MGKTPGKWIKNFILRKKSPKPTLSKGGKKLNSSNREESPKPSMVIVSKAYADPSSLAAPIQSPGEQTVVELEKVEGRESPAYGANLSAQKESKLGAAKINAGSPENSHKIEQKQAATRVQAAFRGYRARRALKTLKGIIRLQAVIRGHLVRRQAIATLSCVWGIVKFQAVFRGRKVRCSDIGMEVQKRFAGEPLVYKNSECSGIMHGWMDLPTYTIVQKLLASLPTLLPLRLQYSSEIPNAAWEWLERWTRLQVWTPHSHAANSLALESQTKKCDFHIAEAVNTGSKQSIRKPASSNVENSSGRSCSENKKQRRNMKTNSGHLVDPVGEQSRKETGKVSKGKPGRINRKLSNPSLSNHPDKKRDAFVLNETNQVKDDIPLLESQLPENKKEMDNIHSNKVDFYALDDDSRGEKLKPNVQRASLRASDDHQDNGVHSARKLPSYMAPTESAKGRLRGQGSPGVSQDSAEKNGIMRRHSLPTSASGKSSSPSPRARGFVLPSGKGAINNNKSLSSSRDCSDDNKTVQAEWRR